MTYVNLFPYKIKILKLKLLPTKLSFTCECAGIIFLWVYSSAHMILFAFLHAGCCCFNNCLTAQ